MTRRIRWVVLTSLMVLGPAPSDAQIGSGYLRIVEGYAEHAQAQMGGAGVLAATPNTPLAVGDRLSVQPGGRVEAALADGSLVRIGGGSDLGIAALARSLDRSDGFSAIDLERGELQVARPSTAGPETLEVRWPGATVYLDAPGLYRLSSDGYASAWVTVREGFAEVMTGQGSTVVRQAETAWLDGARIQLTQALAWDELELWGQELDSTARLATVPYVDPSLAYAAAPLADSGGWVEVSGRSGWQPYVTADWQPYTAGSWSYGPGGLNWISTEPWGWVTSHYGSWDFLPGFGWVWFPGDVYAPAWVYWYWGPTHVGWIPAGFYLSAYSAPGYLPWAGVYGWVGGSWTDYSSWTFCGLDEFGRHGPRRYLRGTDLARATRGSAIPRGLLATDTRSLTPEVWRDLAAVKTRLLAASGRAATAELPDVTRFAVRASDRAEASRWFEAKTAAGRRLAVARPAAAAGARTVQGEDGRGQVAVRPPAAPTFEPTPTRSESPRPTLVRPQPLFSRPVDARPPAASRPPQVAPAWKPPAVSRPPAIMGLSPSRPPAAAGTPGPSISPSRPPAASIPPPPRSPIVSRPPAASSSAPARPPVAPPSWAGSPANQPRDWTRPPSATPRATGAQIPTWTRPPAHDASSALDPRPVVQRVVEDIRAVRQGPPAPQPPPSAQRPTREDERGPQRSSGSSEPPSRGSGSTRRPSDSRKPPGL